MIPLLNNSLFISVTDDYKFDNDFVEVMDLGTLLQILLASNAFFA